MSSKVWVEILEQKTDHTGRPISVGWRTDGRYSRVNGGARWQELNLREQVCRIVDVRGDVLQLGT